MLEQLVAQRPQTMGCGIVSSGCEQSSCLFSHCTPIVKIALCTCGQPPDAGAARLMPSKVHGMTTKHTHGAAQKNAIGLLDSLHVATTSVRFEASDTIFEQGDRCASVMYIERGRVELSVLSPEKRAAVVGRLHAGAFFGEGALAGQRRRKATARALTGCTITIVKTAEMRRRLHEASPLSDRFRSHMLSRNIRIEEDIVTLLFNGSEKRLARALLLLSHVDEYQAQRYTLPKISRNLLAQMSGTTRSKVDSLMSEFRRRGFLERHSARNGGLQIHHSMLSVVLQN